MLFIFATPMVGAAQASTSTTSHTAQKPLRRTRIHPRHHGLVHGEHDTTRPRYRGSASDCDNENGVRSLRGPETNHDRRSVGATLLTLEPIEAEIIRLRDATNNRAVDLRVVHDLALGGVSGLVVTLVIAQRDAAGRQSALAEAKVGAYLLGVGAHDNVVGDGDVANIPLDFLEVDRAARIAVEIVCRARAHQLVVSDRDATIRVQVKVVAIKHGVQADASAGEIVDEQVVTNGV